MTTSFDSLASKLRALSDPDLIASLQRIESRGVVGLHRRADGGALRVATGLV